jgi:ubiquinone/menaquinone biosynthesis C-methylase UbiE
MENNDAIRSFYEEQYSESDREGRVPLEFIRSKSIILRYLKHNDMNIADIAGGAGVYSFWLAEMGHRVHLLDLARNHIDFAKAKAQETNIPLASYTCADARALPYADESMDIVLLMGALYHLRERNDRVRCLSEAKRILKPDGILLCTVISRYSSMVGYYKWGHIDEGNVRLIDESLESGRYNNIPFFPDAFFHTPEEIVSEMTDAGFTGIRLIAVEGFGNAYKFDDYADNEYKLAQLLRHIEMTEAKPELLGVSKNIIAVGRRAGSFFP